MSEEIEETYEIAESYSEGAEEFHELEDPVDTTEEKYSNKQYPNPFYKKTCTAKEIKEFLTKVMETKIIYSSDDIYIRFLYDQLITLRFSETCFNQALRELLYGYETISRQDIIKVIDQNFGFA